MSNKIPPDSIRNIKGIGEKTEKLFEKAGIHTMDDLLHDYPRDYDVYEPAVRPGEAAPGQKVAVKGRLDRRPSVRTFGSNSITIVNLHDETGSLQVNWFHMPFLRSKLQMGGSYVFRGVVTQDAQGRKSINQPEIFSLQAYAETVGRILPVYSLTKGLTNGMMRKSVRQLLDNKPEEPEYLPEKIREQYELAEVNFAGRQIHFPDSMENLLAARKRLAFDEFLFFLLGVSGLRERKERESNHFPMRKVWKTEEVIASLPYKLTKGQEQVWNDMERDLASDHLMMRLIQGDVGSGKTILAFLGMIMAFENGYQSALMAPTEVLASQHYQGLTELLEKNGIEDAHPVLLKGSCTAKEKREIDRQIASGEAKMIIGTHALIQDSVEYADLGLVITDEQHRFGVRQRDALAGKGYPPNVLVMSATPIPRTLAMILYGDLDISLLKEMPAHRLPVKNCVVNTSWRENAWRFIEKEAEAGHQAYVICPMVEPNEDMPCENVTEYSRKLKERFGSRVRVGMLHGQMKPSQKQEVMDAFARGEIQVLVSTTVVEVGVNVPNATVMMIENAERFGLAQLHQLRGRVGRGDAQSYCIFMQGDGRKETSKRLDILLHSNDGFEIAEEDLKLRGPGDLLGVRQSGIAAFQVADIYRDKDILKEAAETARKLTTEDPTLELSENRILGEKLAQYLQRACQNDDRGI